MRRLPFEERRRELIDAAVRVIARDGLAAASTRAIVAEADMPVGAFHYVFESRDALIRALIVEVADAERTAVLAELDNMPDAPTIERLLTVGLTTYLRLLEANPERELAVVELSLHGARHDPELVAEQWRGYHEAAAQSLQHAADLCGTTWLEPVDTIARSLIRSLDGITLNWFMTRDRADAERHIALLARTFASLSAPVDAAQ